jgi:hypothetical protein
MNRITIQSMGALAKCPTEASEVEKPPVATVVMAWTSASRPVIPAAHSDSTHITVSAT